jgi:tetratricopeptide (TPR) repeat protein
MIRDTYTILMKNKIRNLIFIFIIISSQALHAQADKKYIRQGNREYEKNKFSESEISYRKATDKNNNATDAVFNTGDALYKQKKFEDAGKQFMENIKMTEDRNKKSSAMYNLGNSLLKANKVQESIEAYKGSLKLTPDNLQAKYNLAYAQDMLKKQQEQKQQQQNKDKQDKNKDQNKKDQKDQNKENKDQQKDDKQNQDQKQQQDQQQSMTKDDAERLLNALANEEKNVQEKVKLAKAAKERVRTVKNW